MTQTMSIQRISPQRAREIVTNPKNNTFRRVNTAHVTALAEEMRAGRWRLSGEAIKFNCDGSLLDGQHRLLGVIKANTPITTWVAEGVEDMMALDTGLRRTAIDYLRHRGEKSPEVLAAAIRACMQLEVDHTQYNTGCQITIGMVTGWLDHNPNIRATVAVVNRTVRRRPQGTEIPLIAVHFYGSKTSPELATQFVEDVAAGENLAAGNAALLFRNRMLANQGSKRRLNRREIMALCIKAWLFYRDGRAIQALKWNSGGGEEFPALIDEQAAV